MAYGMIDNKTRTILAKYLVVAAECGKDFSYEICVTYEFEKVLRRMGCSNSRRGEFFSAEAIHRVLTDINHAALVAEYGAEKAKMIHPEEDETLDENVEIDTGSCSDHMIRWLPKLFYYANHYSIAITSCCWNKEKLDVRTYRDYKTFQKGFHDWMMNLALQLAYMSFQNGFYGTGCTSPQTKNSFWKIRQIEQSEGMKGGLVEYRDRAKGALWGLVVGDCLGSPIQFSGKDDHPTITQMEPCPVFDLPPGYWTDDSSMAMCIMDSYVRKGGYDLKDIGDTFVKWFKDGYLSSVEGRSFDVGTATWNACQNIEAKGSLVNGDENAQGNGSIMRFAPSWLIGQKECEAFRVMHEISDLTHNSAKVRDVVDRLFLVLNDCISSYDRTLPSSYTTRDEVNNSGWAVSTLQAALWAFNTTSSFKDALIAAVNLGGDADTIGAVCGQIAGARYGYSSIPREWVESVKDWQKVDALIEKFLDAVL